jgi:hypothetical protein
MDATQYQRMFDENSTCQRCHIPTHHFGSLVRDADGLTLFCGSASELFNHPLREAHEREVRQNRSKLFPNPQAASQAANNQKAIA